MSVYIIAEVGPNHNGSLETALEMIQRLSETGCNAIKFQLAVPENVYSRDAFKADYQIERDGPSSVLEMSRRIQLSFDDHLKLHDACRSAGVHYLCTAFELSSLKFLNESFDLPYFKIPSGEILTLDMLDYVAEQNRPILLSTGMATFDEIEFALNRLDPNQESEITVLHCVSMYPAPIEYINLNVIHALRERFGRMVGYSDHSIGPECCLGAVAMGASVVEKHVTLDKTMPGPDHAASATIDEFRTLVGFIRRLDSALGDTEKIFSPEESETRRAARKSIVTVRDINAGETISARDIVYKRPGTGTPPSQTSSIIGKKTKRFIEQDRLIRERDVE